MTAELLLVIVTFCGQPASTMALGKYWTDKDRNDCVSSILNCVETDKSVKFVLGPNTVAKCLVRP